VHIYIVEKKDTVFGIRFFLSSAPSHIWRWRSL